VRSGSGWESRARRVAGRIKRFLSNTTSLVVGIGALAGAVAAVIALLPKPTETFEVSFGSVTAEPGVSLEHYEATATSLQGSPSPAPAGIVVYRLAADRTVSPPVSATVASGEDKTSSEPTDTSTTSVTTVPPPPITTTTSTGKTITTPPSTTTTGKTIPSTSSTPTSTTGGGTSSTGTPSSPALPSPSSVHSIGGADVAEGTGAPEAEGSAVVKALEATPVPSSAERPSEPSEACSSPCEIRWLGATHGSSSGLNAIVEHELIYNNPTRAAQALAARFANCQAKIEGHRLSPVGAVITYNLTLDGFAGRWETVSWSLESIKNGQEVPKCWWQGVRAEQIKPTVDHKSFTGEFWVPMPRRYGDYRVHVVLSGSGSGMTYQSKNSVPPLH
jgi:hypothetical protein